MKEFIVELKFTETATIIIKADSADEAVKKWSDGDYDDRTIEPDEELYGGIPWSFVSIKEVKDGKTSSIIPKQE